MAEKNWEPSLQRFQSFLDLLQSSLQPATEELEGEITPEQWNYVIIQIRKSLVRCKISNNYYSKKFIFKFIHFIQIFLILFL